MGIGAALNIALMGLKASQSGLEVTAGNVANAGSTGYSRRVHTTSAQVAGGETIGVKADTVKRELNLFVQRQWRTSAANAEYASVRSDSLQRLDEMLGGPDNPNSLDAVFNEFKKTLEALATSPEDRAGRIEAAAAVETIATRLRSFSTDIQTLRTDAEQSIGAAVSEANDLLQRITELDAQVITLGASNQSTAGVMDQRDAAIDRLAKLMDIRVEEQPYGGVAIYTGAGQLLYDDRPAILSFDERGDVAPQSRWSTNPDERTLGTVTLSGLGSNGVDLFASGAFRSGSIAAYRQLRDETLVAAQAQLDELAEKLTFAVGNRNDPGTAVTNGSGQEGFSVDLRNFTEGSTFQVSYTVAGEKRSVTFVGTNGATALDGSFTADPNDTVVAIDATQSIDDIIAAIGSAMPDLAMESDGTTVSVYDDGPGGEIDVTSATASVTSPGLQSGDATLQLFIDTGTADGVYTGLNEGRSQKTGYAQRIAINPTVKADPAYLVKMTPETSASDNTRPRALLDAFTGLSFTFSPSTGVGTETSPFSGSTEQFIRQIIAVQGASAENALAVKEGQDIVTNNLAERYEDSRKVDMDAEMAQLIELQTAYQANARVLTAAREMLDSLMRI
ncbi:flagellar hook-associated protein FlgK [Chthonobacter rhizosphaerae]|uniref:flagellar hook-associated protein FlgK n=1 Tax=Chthonobacter rhizosphaerae TaxID=2735553 RepID=UPI0015EF5D38|nr:flagellar hook-associated protein FlgK [Chthonobacter rhizosphaerae]